MSYTKSEVEAKLKEAKKQIEAKDVTIETQAQRIKELEAQLAQKKPASPRPQQSNQQPQAPKKPGVSPEAKKLIESTQPRESVIQVDAILTASEQHESRLMRTVHELAEARQQGHVSTDFSSDDDTDSDDYDDDDCEGDLYTHGWNGEYLDPDELLGEDED